MWGVGSILAVRIPELHGAFLLIAILASVPAAHGQSINLSDAAEISLVTVSPGEAVYSLFGHSAIRVRDPERELDLSYSYGTFHFDDPMFVPKFAMGRLDYFLSVTRWSNAYRAYRDVERRPAVEQVLDLTPDQRDALFAFLQINARVENRYYRYDFLFDNCSTRIRDALKSVLGEQIDYANNDPVPYTFRQLLRPYLSGTPFLELGIDLLLGARTDRLATRSETTFLPDFLEQSFDQAVLIDSAGVARPLVLRKDSLIRIENYTRQRASVPWPGIILSLVAALILIKTIREVRGSVRGEMIDVTLFGLVGLIGCFLLFMWFGTAHHVTAANWNLAWAWPTHLIYAAVVARHGITRYSATYAALTSASTILFIVLWPVIPQDLNESLLAVAVVLAVRSAWAAVLWRRKRAGVEKVRPAPESVKA